MSKDARVEGPILLLMLCPHLLSAQLIVVIHRGRAVRSLHALLLIVHLSRLVNVISTIWIGISVIVLLVASDASMWRLPACHGASNMWAVVAAVTLLLPVISGRFEDLRWVVTRRWIRGERRSVLLLAVGRHWVLSWRLRSWRRLHLRAEVSWNSSHAAVHGVHVIIRSLSLYTG